MKEIANRLFAIDLNEKYNLDMILSRNECFFVCDNIDDTQSIVELARFLHKEGVRTTYFFGKQRELWKGVFDQIDVETIGFSKLSTMMFTDITTTETVDSLEAFAKNVSLANRMGINTYIFFDNNEVYNQLLQMIK